MKSAFEMKDTIEWYEENKDRIFLPKPSNYRRITVEGELEISVGMLTALRNLFPESALERSVFRKVIAKPETWFRHDAKERMLSGKNPSTTDIRKAMSPTAIVPSFYCPVTWTESDIWLYKIPQVKSAKVRKIILAEGFVHELGHTVNFLARYETQSLLLPDGTNATSAECLNAFGELMKDVEPMSHYSSGYHQGNEFFDENNPLRTIDEELSETIAAYLLGFTYAPSSERRFTPFADRPEIKRFVEQYLNAKLVMN